MISPVSTPPVGMPNANVAPGAAPGMDRAPLAGANRFTAGMDVVGPAGAQSPQPIAGPQAGGPQAVAEPGGGLQGMLNLKGPFKGVRRGLDRIMELRKEYQQKVKSGQMEPASPEAQDFRGRMNEEMLRLQIEAGQAQFSVQLAAKVIEHGTSATKNIMQTQI